jgi:hypothetical protein
MIKSLRMMKKVVTLFLIITYMNCYLGCYKTSVLQKPDVNTNDPKLSVTTNGGKKISFDSNMYKFVNDTLFGVGQELIKGESQKSQMMKIALADISSVEITESVDKAVYLIIGTILIMGAMAANAAYEKNNTR